MSVMPRHRMRCERVRELASLRLDGELSELEGALLEGHLGHCRACSSYAVQLEAIVAAVRSAPLEPLPRPVLVPRRYAAFRAARVTAAAATMLVAAGLGSVFAASLRPPATHEAALPHVVAASSDDRQLRDMRRAQLRIERAMLQTNSKTQIGHIA
jgi:anti-sigma factor RsiW